MRKSTLLLVVLCSLALARTASANCIGCTSPCEGSGGSGYECDAWGTGYYGDCQSLADCGGCIGWIDRSCIESPTAELEPAAGEPLLGLRRVTEVVVRHDPAPIAHPAPVLIASAR